MESKQLAVVGNVLLTPEIDGIDTVLGAAKILCILKEAHTLPGDKKQTLSSRLNEIDYGSASPQAIVIISCMYYILQHSIVKFNLSVSVGGIFYWVCVSSIENQLSWILSPRESRGMIF